MSTLTPKLNLIKPELSDAANIEATNSNWDKIDEKMVSTDLIGQPNGVCPLGPDGKIPLEYGGGVPITLTANTEPGATVTVTDNVTTMTQEAPEGVATFSIPNAGEWTATAEKDGANLGRGKADIVDNYNVQLSTTYTVKIALANDNPETACTYTDDAVGMTPGYDGWKDTRLFKSIKPCIVKDGAFQYYLNPNNLAQKETGEPVDITSIDTGDVMVEIPKIGYRMWKDSDYQYVSVTEEQNKPDYCYRAHSLDSEGDCDKIYIGAFVGSNNGNKIYSLSGKKPANNTTLTNFRTFAQSRGTGYQLVSFYPLTLLRCLYLVMYKNRDSQTALGMGLVNSVLTNTGGTIAKGACFGEQTGKLQMCFLHIEDFWGNIRQWQDGLFIDGSGYAKTAFTAFNDTGNAYPFTSLGNLTGSGALNGFTQEIDGSNSGGFLAKSIGASASTYYTDYSLAQQNKVGYFGGDYSSKDQAGAFMNFVDTDPSFSRAYCGCRILFKHKKEVTA